MLGTGWKPEPFSFSDFSHHRIFGAPPNDLVMVPFEHNNSGLPIIYQGDNWFCVACSVVWIRQWQEKRSTGSVTALSQDFLAKASNTAADGATPSMVLDAAKNVGICESEEWLKANKTLSVELELAAKKHGIGGYAYLHRLTPTSIYAAAAREPIMVGVDSYQGSEPHMMVAVGFEPRDGVSGYKTMNWWKEEEQDYGWIPVTDIKFAASVLDKKPDFPARVPVVDVLKSKWSFISLTKKIAAGLGMTIGALLSGVLSNMPPTVVPEQVFGAGGIYNIYSPTVAGAGTNSTQTTLPVSSFTLTDGSGIVISTSTIHFPVYLITNPKSTGSGGNREEWECNGMDTVRLEFIRCYRAIACNNLTGTTSTVSGGAFAHSAGEPVIMSNSGCFFNRFVDDYTTQDIGGTKRFTTSTIIIGNNSTSTRKRITFDVGQANEPGFIVDGPAEGRTTSTILFTLNGTDELQLNASGTTVGGSSTRAIGITGGLIHLNASTVRGLAFDSGDGNLEVRASSTSSTNGGFINFVTSTNALGRIFWDVLAFVRGAWTWVGNQIFLGTVTVPEPTVGTHAATRNYVDQNLTLSLATGTAGQAVAPGNALYISTTGTLFLTSAANTSTSYAFVGIANNTTGTGGIVDYVRPGGISAQFTGLNRGSFYFLSRDVLGAVSSTASASGTIPVRMGIAVSTTHMLVMTPDFSAQRTGRTPLLVGINSNQVQLGWIPTYVSLWCEGGTNSASQGYWALNPDGTSTTWSMGTDDDAVPYNQFNSDKACQWEEGTNVYAVWITTSSQGFSMNTNNFAGAQNVQWVAGFNRNVHTMNP